jgi:hypothetical protein
MITNNFDNIRKGSGSLGLKFKNTTAATTALVDVSIDSGRYDTIAELDDAVEDAIEVALNDGLISGGGTAAVAVTKTVGHRTSIVVTITGSSDTYTLEIVKAAYGFSATLANDLETALGFIDSKQEFTASTASASLTVVSHLTVDINHIRFVQIQSNVGKQKHGGALACIPIHGTVLHGFEEIDLYGSHPLYHAFPLGSISGGQIFRVLCTDMRGRALEGSGIVNVMFKLFTKATLSEYGKRIRMY